MLESAASNSVVETRGSIWDRCKVIGWHFTRIGLIELHGVVKGYESIPQIV